jgi:hypothetical protein
MVELTEQMLAADGVCCADLVIVNEGGAKVDTQTGEIIGIENTSVLSTMLLHIDVTGSAVANSDIESSYEFNGLNTALEKVEAEYTEVMKTSKSWAVGDTGIRDGENTDNAKYYAKQSSDSASAANTSAQNAAESENNANEYMRNTLTYSQNAQTYMDNAQTYMNNAKASETSAKTSEVNASVSEANAKTSETNSKNSEINASKSESKAKESEVNASASEMSAHNSENASLMNANRAQSYAVGGTSTRNNEDYDNAKYYYNLTKNIVIGLDTGFIPMDTVAFAELASVEEATGYVYNISDDFVTDESFREGAGKSYTSGTNVYFCASGQWDCFGGASSPTATVSEVKDYLGI